MKDGLTLTAHNGVIADKGCASEAYKADVGDPAYLEAMEMVNNLSSWLKRYLWRFTGMDPANPRSYLDWFVYLFRVRRAQDDAQDCKGGPPSDHGRRDLPHVGGHAGPPHF